MTLIHASNLLPSLPTTTPLHVSCERSGHWWAYDKCTLLLLKAVFRLSHAVFAYVISIKFVWVVVALAEKPHATVVLFNVRDYLYSVNGDCRRAPCCRQSFQWEFIWSLLKLVKLCEWWLQKKLPAWDYKSCQTCVKVYIIQLLCFGGLYKSYKQHMILSN